MSLIDEIRMSDIKPDVLGFGPNRSPLIYPGGKSWAVPFIRHWIEHSPQYTSHDDIAKPGVRRFIEPFAGGATASLTALFEFNASRIELSEVDQDVIAFWQAAILQTDKLMELYDAFDPTLENLRALEMQSPALMSYVERGFRYLALNRTKYGGIIHGTKFYRRGTDGQGIATHWRKKAVLARLEEIKRRAHRMFMNWQDGLAALRSVPSKVQTLVFIDPPYNVEGGKRAGRTLYKHSSIDMEILFKILSENSFNFMMTLDASEKVLEYVDMYGFHAVKVKLKSTSNKWNLELVITRGDVF